MMARVGRIAIEGRLVVLPHAVQRARERLEHKEVTGKRDVVLRDEIHAQVLYAIKQGHVHDELTKGFGLRTRRIFPWQRFVLSRDGDVGWLIGLDRLPDVTVLTTLRKLPPVHYEKLPRN